MGLGEGSTSDRDVLHVDVVSGPGGRVGQRHAHIGGEG